MKKTMKKTTLALLLLAGSIFANPHNLKGHFGVGGGLGFGIPIGETSFKNVFKGGLDLGAWGRYHFCDSLALSFGYGLEKFGRNTGNGITNHKMELGVLYYFLPNQTLSPVVELGPTYVFSASDYTPSSRFGVKAGIGAEYFVIPHLALGLWGKYQLKLSRNSAGDTIHAIQGLASLTFYFGGGGHGNDPAPVADTKPAPAKENTTPPAADLDSDGDGVVDAKDKCPQTPEGKTVDGNGCPIKKTAEFKLDIKFATASSLVTGKYMGEVKKIADFLKAHPKDRAQIEGHTDNVGSAAKNKVISQKRADAVKQLLVSKFGIAEDRVTAIGFGLEKPLGDNSTAEGRAQNRRVVAEMSVLEE